MGEGLIVLCHVWHQIENFKAMSVLKGYVYQKNANLVITYSPHIKFCILYKPFLE